MKNNTTSLTKKQLLSQVIFVPAIPSVRAVLRAIISCTDLQSLNSHARIDTLAQLSKLSRSTVKRALDTLTTLRLISRRKRYIANYKTNNQARQISSEIKLIIPSLFAFVGRQILKVNRAKASEPQTRPTNKLRSFKKSRFAYQNDKNASAFHAYAEKEGLKHDQILKEAKEKAVSSEKGLSIIAAIRAKLHL